MKENTAWKVSKYGVISGPNTGKYGTETSPYLDTFHAVGIIISNSLQNACVKNIMYIFFF